MVKLSAEERMRLEALIHAGKEFGTNALTRARILLKADVSEAPASNLRARVENEISIWLGQRRGSACNGNARSCGA